MDNNQACQLFKYDHEFFLVTKNSPEYFANEFVENAIDTDYVSWLNFHGTNEKQHIDRLSDHLSID